MALDRIGKPLAAAISRATRPAVIKNTLSGTWLGHQLHPLLTDIPIGSWVAAGMLDITGAGGSGRAARRLVGFETLAAIPGSPPGRCASRGSGCR